MFTDQSYLVPPVEGDYLSVRALTVRGSDTEIGADLAKFARRDYSAVVAPYRSPVYGIGRLKYFDHSYPALADRARGAARQYDVDPERTDTSTLAYDVPSVPACSLVWFPASLTTVGRPLFGRNLDWFTGTLSSKYGLPPTPGEHPSCSRTVWLTTVPSGGRVVAQLGCHDLMSPGLDGVNDAGLMTAVLVDHSDRGNVGASPAGGRASGLSAMQVPGCVLHGATTVAEAKVLLVQQQTFCPTPTNMHWFVADAHGAAMVVEIDGDSRQYYFVDAEPDQPFIVTNHALHRYPTISSFPAEPIGAEHNSFVRYQVLTAAIQAHQGPWTPDDVSALLDVVQCAYVDDKAAGISGHVPERTLWHYVADPDERAYRIRFYQHDIGPEPGTNHMRTKFTDPLEWTLSGALER
ncbi:carcinine hydrolase/isopenicillin-N N-acyltransferase family protein [Nocardia camponoti]|uniref:Peptidase C45 hydrolase domain-containing protein n=1 Tax=Nocardia camponoti TaxID=1616106 RepID=A0A917QRS7_9NOCA|nr:carcinine hydrolase/isopenicillin-N N-acyltransferase family protein [Nocardia camponoti]GGK65201.1 hypothetical protein GCM10011591_41830 [Nocardia camponoti]